MATCFDQHDYVKIRRVLHPSPHSEHTIPANAQGQIVHLCGNAAHVEFGNTTTIVMLSDLVFVAPGRPADVFIGKINGDAHAS